MFRRLTRRSDLPRGGAAFALLMRNQRVSIGMFVTLHARVTRQSQCGWRPWLASGARGRRHTAMEAVGRAADARLGVRMRQRQTQEALEPADRSTGSNSRIR